MCVPPLSYHFSTAPHTTGRPPAIARPWLDVTLAQTNYTLAYLCLAVLSIVCIVRILPVTITAYRIAIDNFRTIVGDCPIARPGSCDCFRYPMHQIDLYLRYVASEHE